MAPKKLSIEKPAVVVEEPPFNPPTETEAEKEARIRAERDAEQELDNAWKKIPYIDQKDLRPGYYAGMEMDRLWKPWQTGGHRHDFYKATRSSRSSDLAKHYEFGERLKRHDKLVFELDNWRRSEFLKDDMKIFVRKLGEILQERERFQKLRKQIRLDQLYYEKSLRLPLSPLAERLDTTSSEEEEPPAIKQTPSEQPSVPSPPSSPLAEIGLEELDPAIVAAEAVQTPTKKLKGPPRIRYSLFHYDIPRHVTSPTPSTRLTSPDSPKENSSPVTIHSPAYIVGKERIRNKLAEEVIALEQWEEKLGGGGGGGGGSGGATPAKKKPSVKK